MRILSRMNVGGPSVQAAILQRHLDPDRFEQRLFIGSVDEGEAEHFDLHDLALHRIAGLGRSVRLGDDARALRELVGHMRQWKPHLVHTHAAKAGALGRIAAWYARVPMRVHTYHGHLLHGYFNPMVTRGVVLAERRLARLTDRIVAVGAQVRDDLLASGIGVPGQYTVVPPGTWIGQLPEREKARADLGLPSHAPIVAYIGRLAPIKRPDRLLDTMMLVRKSLPDTCLVVCGDGPLAGSIGGQGVYRLGWRADVATVYAAADIVMLTSDNEGMPVTLIEAGLAGVASVSTRAGSVAEVVQDGVTGLLCDPDPAALAAAAVRLLTDPALRQRMGSAAAARCTGRFTGARLAADIDTLYSGLALAHGFPARGSNHPAGTAIDTAMDMVTAAESA